MPRYFSRPWRAHPDLPEAARAGDPVPGLTDAELARFEAGRVLFDQVFSTGEGVGPLFNENQCSACHTDPAPGGTGEQRVLKATRTLSGGSCDILASEGGENLRRRATPALAGIGIARDTVPAAAKTATFSVPFLFGLGAADLVPDDMLVRSADPDDRNGDGISGRVGRTPGGDIGRFGRKADVASLTEFTTLALLNEMGLTTTDQPQERGQNGAPLPAGTDPAPDPEISDSAAALITDFVRMLAAPPRRPGPADADPEPARRGQRLFQDIGCSQCHTPQVVTGPSPIAALDRRRARLYSDLLLHDLGPELAGVCGPGASEREYRTAPLIGLGLRRNYLHDLRASRIDQAILLHGGEAEAARDAFAALSVSGQQALLRFLRSL